MNLTLDHTQRLNLHALLGAQRGRCWQHSLNLGDPGPGRALARRGGVH